MVDKNVAITLNKLRLIEIQRKGETYDFSFKSYWQVMEICHKELENFRKEHGNLQILLNMDEKPTTLTRIFDKCAFVMAKQNYSF